MVCFIPTKGRYNTKTFKLFESAGIPFKHFIEPGEMGLYEVPNKINIGADGKGICYVRNFMLNYARTHNHEWVIVCDDDVAGFGVHGEKRDNKDASIWVNIFNIVKDLPFEIVGLNYEGYAWTAKNHTSINKSFVEVCVLLHINKITWGYREHLAMKEDRDFAPQTIKYGSGILRFNRHWFRTPAVGTNKGGLQEDYIKKLDTQAAVNFATTWQPFTKLVYKKGRIDVAVGIKGVALHYNKLIG